MIMKDLHDQVASTAKTRSDIYILSGLFLLAFIFRLIRVFDLDLNFDEVVLLFQAQNSFADIWENCKLDNYPPLYPWLIKIWMLFSQTDWWYRLFGVILGSLTPLAAFLLGKEILDRKFGLFLGLVTAGSATLIFYSQFVRMFNIQPFFVCLSVLWFIKAMETKEWKYWILTSIANLLGFYVYVFMVFLFISELIIFILHNKGQIKKYIRPFVSHLPFLIGVAFWIVPVLQRFAQVQDEFWILPLDWKDYFHLWYFLGSGGNFRRHFILATVINIPFIIGLGFTIPMLFVHQKLKDTFLIFTGVIFIITIISAFGQSFFYNRYLIFLQPVYLGLCTAGYYCIDKRLWKRLGFGILTFSLVVSLLYYYIDYYEMHSYYGFVRSYPFAEPGEGHNLKKANESLASRLKEDEVIIHYSNPYLRVCSYYTSIYYHQRQYSEHIYSKNDIAQYNGRQYLNPGDQIRSLRDLQPLPAVVWILTLDNADLFFNNEVLEGRSRPTWINKENLMVELRDAGYILEETITYGKIVLLHFQRSQSDHCENEN